MTGNRSERTLCLEAQHDEHGHGPARLAQRQRYWSPVVAAERVPPPGSHASQVGERPKESNRNASLLIRTIRT